MDNLLTVLAYNQAIFAVYPDINSEIKKMRNMPMAENRIKLYKNSTQKILIEVRSLSKKLLRTDNIDFYFNLVNQHTNSLILRRTVEMIEESPGRMYVLIQSSDLDNIDPGAYKYSISAIDTNNYEIFMYVNQNADVVGQVEVLDKALPEFIPSYVIAPFDNLVVNSISYKVSGRYPANGQYINTDGVHTVGVYTTNFTGKFYIEGSLSLLPGDFDWVDIDITQNVTPILFDSSTGVNTYNFDGLWQWIRVKYFIDPTNIGSIDKIYYRPATSFPDRRNGQSI